MADGDWSEAAAMLWQARAERRLLPQADVPMPRDLGAAYVLQDAVSAASGARILGWKIGAGDPALQRRFALPGPFVGPLLQGLVHGDGAMLAPMPGAGLECEISLRLGCDLAAGGTIGDAELTAAIAAAIPSLEVIGRRFDGEMEGQGHRLVADGGINVEAVLGPDTAWDFAAGWPPVAATLRVDGRETASGTAASAGLMPPATLLRWLLAQPPLAARGLRTGDLVMTGTLTGVFPLAPDIRVEADFGTLGSVRASAAAA